MFVNMSDIEKLYIIITEYAKPISLEAIFEVFKKKHPNHKYQFPYQIIGLLNADKRIQRYKKNLYVLDSWEIKQTKREIIAEFLNKENNPQSIPAIKEYVNSKNIDNPSSTSSIRTSIALDKSKRFRKFKRGLYGIKGKEYSNTFVEIGIKDRNNKKKEERLKDLYSFINTNHRLPRRNSDNYEEKSLAMWFDKQQQELKIEIKKQIKTLTI